MPDHEILLDEATIRKRVADLGRQLSVDHPDGFVAVGVLKGSFVFLADLLRGVDLDVEVELIATMSYGDDTRSSGHVRLLMDLQRNIRDRHVLLVEDIVDTGRTLAYLLKLLEQRSPATLKTCTLLDKPSRREVDVAPDYVGFEVPDRFVVGYGLDHAGLYRNLPYIAALDEAVDA